MALFLRGVFRTPPACRAIPVLPQCSVGPTPTRNPDATRALGLIYLRDGPRGIKAWWTTDCGAARASQATSVGTRARRSPT